jgi:hypothetical protein
MQAFAPEIDATAPGTTFKEVSGKIVASVPFPLPPLAEQHRIVAMVDELMVLCDRLEAARTAREGARNRLTLASLASITAPDTDTEPLRAHARFAFDALPALATRPDQITTLRQTILDLAVCGKLVEQDPADEPASKLLGSLTARKAEQLRERSIMVGILSHPHHGLPHEIPDSPPCCAAGRPAAASATGTPSGAGRRSRRSPAADRSISDARPIAPPEATAQSAPLAIRHVTCIAPARALIVTTGGRRPRHPIPRRLLPGTTVNQTDGGRSTLPHDLGGQALI